MSGGPAWQSRASSPLDRGPGRWLAREPTANGEPGPRSPEQPPNRLASAGSDRDVPAGQVIATGRRTEALTDLAERGVVEGNDLEEPLGRTPTPLADAVAAAVARLHR
jgi:hypothetical protein